MELQDVATALQTHEANSKARMDTHEANSESRYEKLSSQLSGVTTGDTTMSTPSVKNVFNTPDGSGSTALLPLMAGGGFGAGGLGGGLGAGLLGGVLGGALLGNGGLFGNNRWNNGVAGPVDGFVTPAHLSSSLQGVEANSNTTTILQTLGDIKASIPLAESQVQLALAGQTANIIGTVTSANQHLTDGQTQIEKSVANAIATSLASQNNINQNLLVNSSAIQRDIANAVSSGQQNTYALNTAIRDDGDKTRALLISQNEANLQRMLTVAENALAEQRLTSRSREVEVNVSQTVSQSQAQAQAQQQQQQQLILLNNLWTQVAGLQNAVATNSNLIIGNTGATAVGPQTANPVNVRQ